MTEAQSIALITGALAAVPGTVASIIGYFNHRGIRTNSKQIVGAKEDIVQVGKQINGRMNEQIAMVEKISYAAGVTAEKADEQDKKDVKAEARRKNPKAAPINDR